MSTRAQSRKAAQCRPIQAMTTVERDQLVGDFFFAQ